MQLDVVCTLLYILYLTIYLSNQLVHEAIDDSNIIRTKTAYMLIDFVLHFHFSFDAVQSRVQYFRVKMCVLASNQTEKLNFIRRVLIIEHADYLFLLY